MSYARRMAEICQSTNDVMAYMQLANDADAEIERLRANGIHSCHAHCQRLGCVQRREIERLREALLPVEQMLDFVVDHTAIETEAGVAAREAARLLEAALRADAGEG